MLLADSRGKYYLIIKQYHRPSVDKRCTESAAENRGEYQDLPATHESNFNFCSAF